MLNYFKSALSSLWSNKLRSFLTILGVIIGIASVSVMVSLGEGLKREVAGLIRGLGSNIITVVGGNLEDSGKNSNPTQIISGDILKPEDVEAVKKVDGVQATSPMTLVPGTLRYENKTANPMIIGTTPELEHIVDFLKFQNGRMFDNRPSNYGIVLSSNTARLLFGETDPLFKKIKLNNKEFIVIGVLKKQEATNLLNADYENLALIHIETAKNFTDGKTKIFRILAKVKDGRDVKEVKAKIHEVILANHNNNEEFSVLTQDDILATFSEFLSLATSLVAAIAAISLVVGGVGIMNMMLVTTTERTREIGLRKAIGATRGAILIQFLIESITLTLIGGLFGILLAILANSVIAKITPLHPYLSLKTVSLALSVSLAVGIVFGFWPAWRASSKNPIDALRYE